MRPSSLVERLRKARPSPTQGEWSRIANVPRIDSYDESSVEWVHLKPDEVHLYPTQMQALACVQEHGSLFGTIPVGFGKSLIAWLSPLVAGAKRPIIFMPSNMVDSFRREVGKFRHYFHRGHRDPETYSYGMLSSTKRSTFLEDLRPDMIICDEAHTLLNDNSSRTRRMKRYLDKYPDTKLVMLSGTFIGRDLSPLRDLVAAVLRDNSFVPLDEHCFPIWKNCVDLSGRPSSHEWGALAPLVRAEGISTEGWDVQQEEYKRKLARQAVHSRMSMTPGVVMSQEASCNVPLIGELITIPVPEAILEMIDTLEVGGMLPDGEDIIVEDSQKARLAKTLSLGFFNRWAWEEVGGRDEEWLLRRRAWSRELRRELAENSREHYDSAALVERAMMRGEGEGTYLGQVWEAWDEHRRKLEPPTVPVWVDPFVFRWLAEWLSEPGRKPTIVWFRHQATADALQAIGLRVYGRGSSQPVYQGRHIAASIDVHGTGKNLQAWSSNLFLEPTTNPLAWEQNIGRTHRNGQDADSVELYIMAHTDCFRETMDKARAEAESVFDASQCLQRLQKVQWVGEK